ncbi:hypothetical protein D3C76_1675980 [compost metagenome]
MVQLIGALLQCCIDQRLRFLLILLRTQATKQGADPGQQCIGAAPMATNPA